LIETTDGEQLTGIPVRENEHELVLRTAGDQDVVVQKAQIKTKKPGGSLMPSGLVDNLTSQEQLDLYKFLSDLGKPGPFDASKANVARLWMVAPDPTTSADEQKLLSENMTGKSWHRANTLVNGRLAWKDLETAAQRTPGSILAGAHFRSTKAGTIRFSLTAPADTGVWIDGQSIAFAKTISKELPAGIHTVILKVDGKNWVEPMRLASDDGTFLAGLN